MIARRLNGRQAADQVLQRVAQRVRQNRQPVTLATILVGNRYDSALYVKLKRQAAGRVGIATEYHHLPTSTSQARLEQVVRGLNERHDIHGILLQLPLPTHLDADRVIAVMDPRKDVDGFHPENQFIVPPPIAAVLQLLRLAKPKPKILVGILAQPSVFTRQLASALETRGYAAVVIEPRRWRTATLAVDALVTAIGRGPQLAAKDIQPGTILIDVGIRKYRQQTVGDVGKSCWTVAQAISPVPGGVGPLTIAYVLYNTWRLSQQKKTTR